MPTTITNEKIELKIIDLSSDGRGIAKHDSKVYFAPRTAPGDTIKTKKIEAKKSFSNVLEYDLITASDVRVQARCKYYDECGGCNWMHINKGTQLDSKKTALENHLRRIAKIDHLPEVTVIDTKNDQWRNRIRLHAKVTKQILSTGLYKKNSTDIIAIDDCTICLEPINKWLKWLQANQRNLKLSDDTSFDLQLDLDEKGLNIWPQKIRANNKKSSTHKICLLYTSPSPRDRG